MATYTINKLLAMEKALKSRRQQLVELTKENSREVFWSDKNKEEKPLYDAKLLDKKVTEINNALFEIDHSIKASNAVTKKDIDVNFKKLMEGIE